MTDEQFWFGDIRILRAKQIAYYRNISYSAWLNGVHFFEANTKAISNGNRTKKSDPIEKYNDWKDPIPKPKPTKEHQERNFRKSQANQNLWLHNMINKT